MYYKPEFTILCDSFKEMSVCTELQTQRKGSLLTQGTGNRFCGNKIFSSAIFEYLYIMVEVEGDVNSVVLG